MKTNNTNMHACDINFVGINVRGRCLISKNHEHFIPSKYTHYTVLVKPLLSQKSHMTLSMSVGFCILVKPPCRHS